MATSAERYQIEERLAAGGMGEVYRARMIAAAGLEKVVALKLVRRELSDRPELRELFVEEARTVLSLSHANIVQAFDVGVMGDRYFIAMEYVHGRDLGRIGRLPLRHAVAIAVEVLKGVDYAHRLRGPDGRVIGLVHRDISPSNILLSFEGEVKIADFGVASTIAGSRLAPRAGKLSYMSPEQLAGSAVDARADLYAVGAVLYETLSGRPRALGATDDQIIANVAAGRHPPLAEVAPEVPPELAAIVARCLAIAPEDRFPSAGALRAELERAAQAAGLVLSTADIADHVVEHAVDSHEPQPPPGAASDPIAAVLFRMPEPGGLSRLEPAPARETRTMGVRSRPRSLRNVAAIGLAGIASVIVVVAVATRGPGARRARTITEVEIPTPRGDSQIWGLAISPDGHRIVYGDGAAIWEQQLASGTRRRMAPWEGFGVGTLHLHPDGKRVLVCQNGIRLIDRATGAVTVVVDRPADACALSRDGETLVSAEQDGLYALELASRARRLVMPLSVGDSAVALAMSPDGQRIACIRARSAQQPTLQIVSLATGDAITLQTSAQLTQVGSTLVAWPEPSRLIYALQPFSGGGSASLMELPVDQVGGAAGAPLLVRRWRHAALESAAWAENARRLVLVRFDSNYDVYSARVDGEHLAVERRTTDPTDQLAVNFTQRGDLLVASDRSGDYDVYSLDSGGAMSPVIQGPGHQTWAMERSGELLHWDTQPQGIRLIAGHAPVLRFPVGAEPGPFDPLPPSGVSVRCAAAICILRQLDGAQETFSVLDVARGGIGPPFRRRKGDLLRPWGLSPDGSELVVADGSAIELTRVDDGTTLTVPWHRGKVQGAAWSADPSRLLLTGEDETGFVLWSASRSGEATELHRSRDTWLLFPLASPDGRFIAFTGLAMQTRLVALDGW